MRAEPVLETHPHTGRAHLVTLTTIDPNPRHLSSVVQVDGECPFPEIAILPGHPAENTPRTT